jgi:hypothetical protein
MLLRGLESSNEKLILFSKFRKKELVKVSSLLEEREGDTLLQFACMLLL